MIDASRYSKFKLLIADDEADLLEIYKQEFELRGFQVITAGSGREAINFMEKDPSISVIISDFRMPDGNGLDIVRAAAKMERVIPVIIITGYVEKGVVDALLEGATAVHSKPISFKEVLSDIDRVLELASFEQNRRHYFRKPTQVTTRLQSDELNQSAEYQTRNISIGGLGLVEIEYPLIVNTPYAFTLLDEREAPPKDLFKGFALCRWQRKSVLGAQSTKFEAGLAFDDNTSRQMVLKNILKRI